MTTIPIRYAAPAIALAWLWALSPLPRAGWAVTALVVARMAVAGAWFVAWACAGNNFKNV